MIVSISGAEIPEGDFIPSYEVIGATREECIEALTHSVQFAVDHGTFERTDTWLDDDGDEHSETKTLYRMVGGAVA